MRASMALARIDERLPEHVDAEPVERGPLAREDDVGRSRPMRDGGER
jgi:hypothetical protein